MTFENPEEKPKKESVFKKIKWKKVFAFLNYKIPLGLVLFVALAILIYVGVQNFRSEDPASMKPVIEDAIELNVNLTMCNEKVDDLGLDVRQEEIRLQDLYQDRENVEQANFNISRINCEIQLEESRR